MFFAIGGGDDFTWSYSQMVTDERADIGDDVTDDEDRVAFIVNAVLAYLVDPLDAACFARASPRVARWLREGRVRAPAYDMPDTASIGEINAYIRERTPWLEVGTRLRLAFRVPLLNKAYMLVELVVKRHDASTLYRYRMITVGVLRNTPMGSTSLWRPLDEGVYWQATHGRATWADEDFWLYCKRRRAQPTPAVTIETILDGLQYIGVDMLHDPHQFLEGVFDGHSRGWGEDEDARRSFCGSLIYAMRDDNRVRQVTDATVRSVMTKLLQRAAGGHAPRRIKKRNRRMAR